MIKSNIKYEFKASREKIWNIITNNQDYSWRSDLSKIEMVDDDHFTEYTKKNYPTYFTITEKREPEEYRFHMENTNMKGNWIGILKQLPNGNTEIDFTEEIEVNHFIMKLLAKSYLKTQQKQYIADLERALKEESPC